MFLKIFYYAVLYSEPDKTSKVDLFEKINNEEKFYLRC